MRKKPEGWHKYLVQLRKSVWSFPAVLLLILILFTALKISGSSVGIYHDSLYGAGTKDSNLIYGKPRAIRADEWLTGTQLLVAQSKNGFPIRDKVFKQGQDLSMVSEIPTKDWPVIFKPHLWAFFVLPVEYAFAFKWWLILYLLIVSCYFFILRVFPGHKLFAALISIAVGLSPFELWWYQAAAFLTIAYGFLILILLMRIYGSEPINRIKSAGVTNAIYIAALAFLFACFGLILYPPFQIAVIVVLLTFAAGYILNKKFNENFSWAAIIRKTGLVLISVLIAAIIGALFVKTHHTPIKALSDTLYPGARTITSGGLNFLKIFDGFMQPQLQSDFHGGHFLGNQSEDSSFILLLPFLLIPSLALIIYEYKKHRRVDWIFLAIQFGCILFLARVFIHFGDFFYKALLLQKVPHERLKVGIGFIGILQLIYLAKKLTVLKINKTRLLGLAAGYTLVCFVSLILIGLYTIKHYPLFINRRLEVLVLALLFSGIIALFLLNRKVLAATLLLIFTLGSSFQILPLYRGLGELTNSKVINKMAADSGKNDTWATVGDDAYIYQNYGLLAGRTSLSGSQIYPNEDLWKQTGDPNYNFVTNREAHIVFTDNPALKKPLTLVHENSFNVKFECSDFIKNNIQYALSIHPLKFACVKQIDTVKYPATTFYIYRIAS